MVLAVGGAIHAYAAGESATVASSPDPIVTTKPFEVTIKTSDFGSDVYCYTWAVAGSEEIAASGSWDGAINQKFKMSGSSGTYTLKVDNVKSFYGMTDQQLGKLTKIGFIARTTSRQTDDLFISVVQGAVSSYSGGDGSSSSPYILKTADDIKSLAETPSDWESGVYFEMAADITVGTFSGIGSMDSPFKGNFDGKGFSLKNVVVSNSGIGSATGVFNAIEGAVIKNVGVVDASMTGATFTGGLVGCAKSGTVERCFSSGSVTSASICAGGLIGDNRGASVSDCYSTSSVTNEDDYATGGLVGKNNGSIKNTYASGQVTAYNYAGGLVGANYGTISASVTMNAGMTATSGGNYIARFGGNNNSQNNVSNTLGWKSMPLSGASSWTDYGHHADDHSAKLTALATYQNVLGWDFDDVWEWRTEGAHSFPVLAGMNNQSDPATSEFYQSFSGIDGIGNDDSKQMSVFPNPVETVLNVSVSSGIGSVSVYSMSGRQVVAVECDGAADTQVDCSGLASGIYLLSVKLSDGGNVVEKIIKK